jgi:hypothetical protein
MQKSAGMENARTYHNVQRFLGLVQYLAQFLPDITAYTEPLAAITRNGDAFAWRPIHDACFENIKLICCKTPILRPIDPSLKEPTWIICRFGIRCRSYVWPRAYLAILPACGFYVEKVHFGTTQLPRIRTREPFF